MKSGRSFGLGVALVLLSTAASAFEEQAAPVPAPQTAAPAASGAAQPLDLAGAAPAAKAEEGTEVRIPGLGKLGVLPKMDFGLELLYGANDAKAQAEERDLPDDELMVRGTVKHSF